MGLFMFSGCLYFKLFIKRRVVAVIPTHIAMGTPYFIFIPRINRDGGIVMSAPSIPAEFAITNRNAIKEKPTVYQKGSSPSSTR